MSRKNTMMKIDLIPEEVSILVGNSFSNRKIWRTQTVEYVVLPTPEFGVKPNIYSAIFLPKYP